MPKKPRPAVVGPCYFCGEQKPLTREHVFPDWLRRVLPRLTGTSWQILTSRREVSSQPLNESKRKDNGYNIGSTQLKVVCVDCNGGWMSRLQEAAIPLLTPLINGEIHHIPVEHQVTIAQWVIMTVSMQQLTNPEPKSHIITSRERNNLRLARLGEAPMNHQGWTIGLAHFMGTTPEFIAARQQAFGYADESPRAQTSVIRLGDLCVMTWSSAYEDVAINRPAVEEHGVRIVWPDQVPLPWPPKVKVGNVAVDRLLDLLRVRFNDEELARQTGLLPDPKAPDMLWTPHPRSA